MSALADLDIVATGCAIVLSVLALLWGLTAGMGGLVALGGRLKGGRRTASEADGRDETTIPAHHLVAIAAAVEAAIDKPHRIVGISAPAHRVPAWTGAGLQRRPDRLWADGGPLNKRTDGL